MPRLLRDLADVHYGKSPNDVLHQDGQVRVVGTGGVYGRATNALFQGLAVVVPRKDSLGNPQYMSHPLWPVDTTYAVLPKRGVSGAGFTTASLGSISRNSTKQQVYRVSAGIGSKRSSSAMLTTQLSNARIAEILSTVDEAIEHTEALIAKTQQIKAGLMHDLFTRGVTPDGQLRPPQQEAPQLYKDSPLGWIPRAWDFGRLRTRADVKGGKRVPAEHQFSEASTAFRYLHTTDFIGRPIAYEEMTHISQQTFDALSQYEIVEGNIYISIAGVNLGWAGVFRPTITDQTILTENAAKILLDEEDSREFVATQINAPSVQRQVQVETGIGAGVPKLALFRIQNRWLAWPYHIEQDRICERYLSLDFQLNAQRDEYRKLLGLKQGLMQDLLTGRVQVTTDPHPSPLPEGEGAIGSERGGRSE